MQSKNTLLYQLLKTSTSNKQKYWLKCSVLMAYEVFGVKLSAIVMGLICIFTCFHVAFEIAYIANGATLSFFFFLPPSLFI